MRAHTLLINITLITLSLGTSQEKSVAQQGGFHGDPVSGTSPASGQQPAPSQVEILT